MAYASLSSTLNVGLYRIFVYVGRLQGNNPGENVHSLDEQVLDEFQTSSAEECFKTCADNALCIGENVYQLEINRYRCVLITLTGQFVMLVKV